MNVRLLPLCLLVSLVPCALFTAGPQAHADEAADVADDQPPPLSRKQLDTWLAHEAWHIRSLVMLDLQRMQGLRPIEAIAARLPEEAHAYVLACGLKVLASRARVSLVAGGGPPLIDQLIRLARHPHPTVRTRALKILGTLPPKDEAEASKDLSGLVRWWLRNRQAIEQEQKRLRPELLRAVTRTSSKTGSVAEKTPRLYDHLDRIRTHGLELVIVMDHTGSMGPVIGAAKVRAVKLIRQVREYVPRFRAGLVTYDDAARLRIPLTTQAAALEKAFRKVAAGGGGDYEEGVDKGIAHALVQELIGWSRSAQRVIVVVGDAPPHDGDVRRLLRMIRHARDDDLYDLPIVVHTVSTQGSVESFPEIARAGGGAHVRLRSAARLVQEMIVLVLGGHEHRARITAWMREIEALRTADPK